MADEALAPGLLEEQEFRNKGVPEELIKQERARKADDFLSHGVPENQVKDYYGIKDPDMGPMKAYVSGNLNAAKEATKVNPDKPIDVNPIEQFFDDVKNGFVGPEGLQRSTLGLALRGKMPDALPPEHAHRAYQIAGMIGNVVGDLPAMAEGEVLGIMGGTAAGTAVGGPVGGVVGGAAGAMAGPFAFPAALRKTLMDYYEKGTIQNPEDFMNRLASTTYEAIKQGGVGLATLGTAKYASPVAAKMLGNMGGGIATKAAEVTALTVASAMAEGQLPHADDFLNAGIVIGGLHGAGLASSKLRGVFASTGIKPEEAVTETSQNLPLKQDLLLSEDGKPPLEETPKEFKAQNLRDEFRQDFVDNLDPIKKAQEFLGVDKETPIDKNPHEVFQYARTWSNNLKRFMTEGTLDFKTGEKNGEGWDQVMKDVPDKAGEKLTEHEDKVLSSVHEGDLEGKSSTWKKFTAYMISRSALERQNLISERTGEIKKTGVDLTAAEEVVKAGEAEYEPVAKRLNEFEDRVLKYAVDSGITSEKGAEAMREAHQAHIPFNRLQEPDPLSGVIKGSGQPYKMFVGSERKILDPFVSMFHNTAAVIKEAERNRAVLTLAKLVDSTAEGKQVGEIVKNTVKPIKVQNQEVRNFLESHGADSSDIPTEPFTIFRPNYRNPAPNEIAYMDKGARKILRLRTDVAEAVKALDMNPQSTKMWVRMIDGMFSTSAKIMRFGVVSVPEFIINNAIRDQFDSGVQTQYKTIPIYDTIKSIGNIWTKDDVWHRAMSSGSLSEGWQHVSKYADTDIWKLDQQTGFLNKAWNGIKSPFQFYHELSTIIEQAPRLAEAKNTGGLGSEENPTTFAQKMEAGKASREVTVNFDQVGRITKTFAPYIPFMKVGISGTDKLFKNMREDPKGTAIRASAIITIPSIMAWWYNKDDSRYQNAPDWLKMSSMIFCTDKWEKPLNDADVRNRQSDLKRQLPNGSWEVNNGAVYHIPRPFGLGILFGALPETMLNSLYKKDPQSFEEFGKAIVGGVTPNLLPPLALPWLEQKSNRNFFTERQIVPNHLQQMFSDHQYNEYTSETAKQLGKVIKQIPFLRDVGNEGAKLDSPEILDNYIREWTGNAGMYVTRILDASLHAAGIGELAPKPISALADLPIIRAFTLRYPSAKAQVIEDFYQRYEVATKAINSYRDSAKKGHESETEQIIDQYGPQMGKFTMVAKALSQGNKTIQQIYADPEIRPDGVRGWTPIEKRQLIDQTYYQMIQAAVAGHQAMDQFMKDFNKDRNTREKTYGIMRQNIQ